MTRPLASKSGSQRSSLPACQVAVFQDTHSAVYSTLESSILAHVLPSAPLMIPYILRESLLILLIFLTISCPLLSNNLIWRSQFINIYPVNKYWVPTMCPAWCYVRSIVVNQTTFLTSGSFLSASLSLSWSHLCFLCFFLKCTELG